MQDLARSLIGVNRGAEAIPLIDEYLRRSAGKADPYGQIGYMTGLRLECFRAARDVAGCRDTVAKFERLGLTDAGNLYSAACFRSVTASVLGQDPGAADEAEKAMDWLKKAVAAGWRKREHMEKDSDLDALRSRDDFRKLIESLPKPPPAAPPASK